MINPSPFPGLYPLPTFSQINLPLLRFRQIASNSPSSVEDLFEIVERKTKSSLTTGVDAEAQVKIKGPFQPIINAKIFRIAKCITGGPVIIWSTPIAQSSV